MMVPRVGTVGATRRCSEGAWLVLGARTRATLSLHSPNILQSSNLHSIPHQGYRDPGGTEFRGLWAQLPCPPPPRHQLLLFISYTHTPAILPLSEFPALV